MPFKDTSYLELWWPFRKLEQDQLFNYAREIMRNNSVKLCYTELVVLLCLSSWGLMIVLWFFLTMTLVCLKYVIVVFPDHNHYF